MGRLGERIRGLLSGVGDTLEPFAQGAERAAGGIGSMLAAAGGSVCSKRFESDGRAETWIIISLD